MWLKYKMEHKRKSILMLENINATRAVTIAFGLLAGLTGIIAGCFEILQGYTETSGFKISTVGTGYSMWENSTYSAFTIISNYLLTGIAAVFISLLLTLWVIFFIHKKYGPHVMILLSLIQFFWGGAIVIDIATLSAIMATQINKPLNWLRKHFSVKIQRILAGLWPWSFLFYVLLSFIILLLTIFGINSAVLQKMILIIAAVMFLPILLCIFGGFAYDILRQNESS
jgi:hypothetical protein